MASQVEIANMALRSLGANPITSLSQASEEARKIDAVYDLVLKSMLRSHPWNFAKKETALSQLTETPTLEDYDYIYSLPSDYLTLIKTSVEPTYTHKIKGRRIYSNSSTLSIEYVYFCEDTEQFDAEFVDAFAARLAAELCYAITADKTLQELKWDEFKTKFNLAKSLNGQENTPDEATQDQWLNARI